MDEKEKSLNLKDNSFNYLWMIPSENVVIPIEARDALSLNYCNRYNFKYNLNRKKLFFGTDLVQQHTESAVADICELFSANYGSIKPLSGLNCMLMVITTFSKPGDNVLTLDTDFGGHTHTTSLIEQIGRRHIKIPMKQFKGWYDVDYDKLVQIEKKYKPRLLYIDPMSFLYELDIDRLNNSLSDHIYKHFDCSHVFTLIAGKKYKNPLEFGFNSIGGSTHKTMPSVQKAFFACREKIYIDRFKEIGEQLVSSSHSNSIIALGLSLNYCKNLFDKYSTDLIKNKSLFSTILENKGVRLFGRKENKSDNHILFINTIDNNVEVANNFYRYSIVTHPIKLPKLNILNGLRIGLQELTWLDINKTQIELLANIFAMVIHKKVLPIVHIDDIEEIKNSLYSNYLTKTLNTKFSDF